MFTHTFLYLHSTQSSFPKLLCAPSSDYLFIYVALFSEHWVVLISSRFSSTLSRSLALSLQADLPFVLFVCGLCVNLIDYVQWSSTNYPPNFAYTPPSDLSLALNFYTPLLQYSGVARTIPPKLRLYPPSDLSLALNFYTPLLQSHCRARSYLATSDLYPPSISA